MPFLGKDWRSSGEQWIRTEHGWERTRVLECILDNLNIGLNEEKVRKKLYNKKSKTTSGSGRHKASSKRLDSVNDDDEMEEAAAEEDDDRMNSIDEEERAEEEESDEGWNYVYDELSLLSDDEDEEENQPEEEEDEPSREMVRRSSSTARGSKSSVFMMRSRSASQSIKSRQPHIIYWEVDAVNRENNAPKATISEVLNALDMPGAVKDIKRFNYVCRLVQIIINEKLNQLSGNAQRTLFMIVKHMLIQVIKSQENLNVMRKLLHDFKKKIQDSIYFYFYYIGSQKLCDRHLATIAKWQEILENPNHHRKLKRLHHSTTTTNRKASSPPFSSLSSSSSSADSSSDVIATNEPEDNENNKENESQSPSPPSLSSSSSSPFESIPIDCKLEIMRRLNCGLDLVNLAKCSRNLNDLVSSELKIWKNLCQFHFQQASINSFVNRLQKNGSASESVASSIGSGNSSGHESSPPVDNDLDWKQIYFRLKRRYGHREIYTDMVHKCCHCKSLFWKEIGHPCVIMESLAYPDSLEFRSEPITPKKLIELLLK